MPTKSWTLEKAKNSFSAVVAAAERGEPQLVTKRGRPAAYVVSADEFQRLRGERETPKDDFVQYLLSIPKRARMDVGRRGALSRANHSSITLRSSSRSECTCSIRCSFQRKRSGGPHPRAAAWLGALAPDTIFLSVATLAEINRGIAGQRKSDPTFAMRLDAWADGLQPRFGDRLLGVNVPIAKVWGLLWHALSYDSRDIILAATALVHDLTVVTRNVRHFERTGVAILNPYEEPA